MTRHSHVGTTSQGTLFFALLSPIVLLNAAGVDAFSATSAAGFEQRVRRSAPASCATGLVMPGMSRGTCAAELGLPKAFRVRGGETFASATADAETFEFEAEVTKVMDIIINSLYSDKDIFLRELVSNGSDACDKKRFLTITEDSAGGYEGRIRIIADKEANTLTIEDNGIGMTRKELQGNLGRIAQSGTKKFTEALGSGADVNNLIGQFGVGFYSGFLVADKITVVTKAADGEQLRWESEAASKYTISADDSPPIEKSGTRLILTLKEDADKYLDDYTLRSMLKRYSEFISFPIELWAEKTEYDTVPDPDAEVKEGEEPPTKTVPRTTNVWEKVNIAKPLWMRPPKEVTAEEYEEFYKTTFKAYDTPLSHVHFSLEGQVEFRAMLFCPSAVPWELSQDMFNEKVKPMKLFVKRVFISDSFEEQLLPRWLSFLKGMVDSEDLPLNVSRELLQKSRVLSIISKRLVRKALDMFKEISKDEEKFAKFTEAFGRYIKVGVIEDRDNKDALLKLASFATSEGDNGSTLPDYVSRMKEGQKQIYYLSGASKAAAASSPVLERLQKQGYEVLYALDQIDEIALQGVGKFDDFDVVDAAKENAELGEMSDEEKKEADAAKEELEATTSYIKKVLGSKVDKVAVSTRLTTSPSALVQPQWGMSPQMQRFMKAQAAATGQDEMAMSGMASNLEINPKHEVIGKLKAMLAAEGEPPAGAAAYAELLFEVAAISSGYELSDPAGFAKRVVALMGGGEEALADATDFDPSKAEEPVAPEDTPIEPEVL
jgi:molecular chaperone HtpG